MRGKELTDWRTVQMFLSEDGVAEVQIDNENPKLVKCDCPRFQKKGTCKHSQHIFDAMKDNNGHYTVMVPEEIDEDVVHMALSDPESMRDFIIRHARVVVV